MCARGGGADHDRNTDHGGSEPVIILSGVRTHGMYCLNQAEPRSGFDLIVEGSELLWLRDAEVAANLASQVVIDIAMPWNGTAVAKSRVVPPRMTATFARRSLQPLNVRC